MRLSRPSTATGRDPPTARSGRTSAQLVDGQPALPVAPEPWDQRFGMPLVERNIPKYQPPPKAKAVPYFQKLASSQRARPGSAIARPGSAMGEKKVLTGDQTARPQSAQPRSHSPADIRLVYSGGAQTDWDFRTHRSSGHSQARAWPEYEPEASAPIGRRWTGTAVGELALDGPLPKIEPQKPVTKGLPPGGNARGTIQPSAGPKDIPGRPVRGLPRPVPPYAPNCIAYGDAVHHGVAQCLNSFTVLARDVEGRDCESGGAAFRVLLDRAGEVVHGQVRSPRQESRNRCTAAPVSRHMPY